MDKPKTSRLPGFYKSTLAQRRSLLAGRLADNNIDPLLNGGVDDDLLDRLVENAVGIIGVPVGVATNFLIDDKEILVTMAVEEPSVIAAASNAARIARSAGGFKCTAPTPHTVAQVEILNAKSDAKAVEEQFDKVAELANSTQPELVALGGGLVNVEVREQVGDPKRMVVHLVVNCLDAMGANIVNTMAEKVAPHLEKITGGTAGLKILTNLADKRIASAQCAIDVSLLAKGEFDGVRVAKGIAEASNFASADPYRAATHNKGIFNGIDAVLLATGNDWRAVEAGAHAFAVRDGAYRPLATWEFDGNILSGKLELPMAVGVVGGASKTHPCAQKCLEIMNVTTAADLARIATSVGLASNLAALMALSTEGIQKGHMRLHQKRI